ncbi:VTT domain-containing protein [Pseudomonas veronii]|jgi:membrane protein DedA with SNARE-associated domain/membrane-associated phospholipid phosphatase|uniref:bifunctional DedA family/phosphatase PAP2 family protein n=2 Tax=Pseudomonas veronii TaxID=76761 RepID=UPI0006267B2B|nr:bifunctional DedA family/phosphatase PAP2 family protein [Pseudomonas veronii]NMX50246.1 phosphatase PAP2 family protein [Pseudomonas veronii]UHH29462.1 phosphatase PAP2 family protein [Pseudomonas veronii]
MMTSMVSSIIEFLTVHPHVAYLAVFLLALSESVPIIGAVVPGTAVILALSALVPSGVLLLWPLLIAATLGAIAGDGLSFWLGHRYHREILGFWPLNRHPELIQSSEAFFERHGAKSVFLARFVPGVRAFIPLLAGMMGMVVSRFYTVNVVSALAWASSHILSGVLVGATFRVLGSAAKPLAILLVVLLVAGWTLLHIMRWTLRRGVPYFIDALGRLRYWAGTHDSWLSRRLSHLLDPSRPEVRTLAVSAVLLVGAAWLFFGILEDVVTGDPLLLADSALYHALQELRTVPGDTVMIAITELGDTTVVAAVTLIVLLWLMWKRSWRTAAYWLIAIAGASALNSVIKVALHRARPGELLYSGWSAFSFPSGHSTVNVVLYGFLAFLIAREIRPAWRLVVVLGAATLIFLIAFSRLYLGAHWFSDVLGGLAFGSAWLALLGLSYLGRQAGRIEPIGLLAAGCSALILAGGLNIYRSHATDSDRYAVKVRTPSMAASDWWASDWQQLPVRRIDLTGETNEPLTFQWAGGLPELQDVLQRNGWRDSADWTLLNALNWLSVQNDPAALPVIPLFASGRLPSLTLVRTNSGGALTSSRLVLRVWVVDFELTNGRTSPLWIGSVVEERFYHPLSLFTLTSTQQDVNAPRGTLTTTFEDGRLLPRIPEMADEDWDGKVLLARHHEPTHH